MIGVVIDRLADLNIRSERKISELEADNTRLKGELAEYQELLKSMQFIRTNEFHIRYEVHNDLETQAVIESGFYLYKDDWEGGHIGPHISIQEAIEAYRSLRSQSSEQRGSLPDADQSES